MGLEYRESDYIINQKNAKEFAPGMVVNLILGFQDIVNQTPVKKDAKSEK
jgi:nucleosome binding factor SPN SPT16 subunit